ncbi:MAG: SidA/IucD/PvdA family monooxygenase [Gammaproteobacteria bacterium]|nr:SidA/IucD/PvdA family monooxygenase [Gammaproteobacteria bacterium]
MTNEHFDLIGIGIGPFNLSLAALAEPIKNLKSLFVDGRDKFDWHPGMMLDSATLQTPFMSDLVTLADPTHPLSFLNYAKLSGKLYSFYIRENFFLMRREYNQYCQWVTRQLTNLRFNAFVETVSYCENQGGYILVIFDRAKGQRYRVSCNKLVIGTGPKPAFPACCEFESAAIIHSSQYLKQKSRILNAKSITVLGSGQSAAEIFEDLLDESAALDYQINWLTQSPRFFPLEYTKLTLEMTSPEYVDYFYSLPAQKKEQLIQEQKQLYKGINSELINTLFDKLYIKNLHGQVPARLMTNSRIIDAKPNGSGLRLTFRQLEEKKTFEFNSDVLIAATGYKTELASCLDGIKSRINFNSNGQIDVARNYSVGCVDNEIFVQNSELHTHGFVTPDLGMACYRNSLILRSICGEEIYPIEQKIAFQSFSAAEFQAQEQNPRETVKVAKAV